MARQIPPDRFEQLVECATQIFIEQGYRRTQMADVATALGVSKGAIYLYVESKEALFDLVVRHADGVRPLRNPARFPVRTPRAGATLRYVRERLAQNRIPDVLEKALGRKQLDHPGHELEAIVRELYALVARNRCGLKLIDRAARDRPDLAALWFEGARGGLMDRLVRYLDDRIHRGLLRAVPDTRAAARLVVETVVFWAVHRHWDSHPQPVDDATALETVVHFLVTALAKE
jgi:AcrR family transcriptional regulator